MGSSAGPGAWVPVLPMTRSSSCLGTCTVAEMTWKLTRCCGHLYAAKKYRPYLAKALCQLPGDEPGSQKRLRPAIAEPYSPS